MISIRWTPFFPPLEKSTMRTPTNGRRSFWCVGGVWKSVLLNAVEPLPRISTRTQKKKAKQPFLLYHQKQTKPFSTSFYCRFLLLLVPCQILGRTSLHVFWGSAGFPPSSATTAAGDDAPRCGTSARRAGAGSGQCHVDGGGEVFWGSRCDLFQIPKKSLGGDQDRHPWWSLKMFYFSFGCFRLQITMRICQVQSSAVQPSPVQPLPVQPPPVLTEAYEAARSLGRIGGCLDRSWWWWWWWWWCIKSFGKNRRNLWTGLGLVILEGLIFAEVWGFIVY